MSSLRGTRAHSCTTRTTTRPTRLLGARSAPPQPPPPPNATDQVGRGLLGAFLVEPTAPDVAFDREYIWISNDALGGFTINGHGFPATVPVLVAQGETVLIRFMNEGVMAPPRPSPRQAQAVGGSD